MDFPNRLMGWVLSGNGKAIEIRLIKEPNLFYDNLYRVDKLLVKGQGVIPVKVIIDAPDIPFRYGQLRDEKGNRLRVKDIIKVNEEDGMFWLDLGGGDYTIRLKAIPPNIR